MEAIYYVMSWLCHRKCEHCYESRFKPYYGEEQARMIREMTSAYPKIIANLPERMTYLDLADPSQDGSLPEKQGRVILSGGEILLKQVREVITYPAMELLYDKYRNHGGVEITIQTTGDLLNDQIVDELLQHHVGHINVSGLDLHHDGIDPEKLQEKLTRLFEAHGMTHREQTQTQSQYRPVGRIEKGPFFNFYGAVPGSWIGELWPRGRTMENEISTATLKENFCARRSGGVDFLQYRHSGSKVSIEPNGNVYPCCVKTKAPIGCAADEPLEAILARYVGNPVYEAISMGRPERMGLSHGWSVEKFIEKSIVRLPSGKLYQNLCVGCDRFHEEVLMNRPPLVSIQRESKKSTRI
jgi:hypothetical protein